MASVVSSTSALKVSTADSPNDRLTVTFLNANRSSGTVYYKAAADVSASSNDGSLAPGAQLTLDRATTWFLAAPAADGSPASAQLAIAAQIEQSLVRRPDQTTPNTLLRVDQANGLQWSTDHGSNWRSSAMVFNVKDAQFAGGAKGDGVTDDTAAEQAAITAAGLVGGTVHHPPGTYVLTSVLTISSAVTMTGCGKSSVLKQTGAGHVFSVTANNVVIRDLGITGNPASSATNGAVFTSVTDCEITGCYFTQIRLFGVHLNSSSRCLVGNNIFATTYVANTETNACDVYVGGNSSDNRITGNRCESTNKNGGILLQLANANEVQERNTVTDNYVTGTIRNPSNTAGQGILIYSANTGQTIRQNIITRNRVVATTGAGIYLDSGTANSAITDTIVAHNQLYGCLTQGSAGVLNDAVIAIDNAPRSNVSNNVIVGGGDATTNSAAIGLNLLSDDVLVQGNHGSTLASFGNGLTIRANANVCNRLRAIGNYFDGNGNSSTIYLANGTGHIVEGNLARAGAYRGIEMGANTIDTTVVANVVVSSTGAAFAANGGALRARFFNNRAISAGSFRADGGTDSEWRGNRQSSTGPTQGRAVLVGGTVTVTTAEVIASENISLTRVVTGGTVGHLTVGTITAGTNFVINSSSGTDTSTVFWEIVH